jgi:hypothetical protein
MGAGPRSASQSRSSPSMRPSCAARGLNWSSGRPRPSGVVSRPLSCLRWWGRISRCYAGSGPHTRAKRSSVTCPPRSPRGRSPTQGARRRSRSTSRCWVRVCPGSHGGCFRSARRSGAKPWRSGTWTGCVARGICYRSRATRPSAQCSPAIAVPGSATDCEPCPPPSAASCSSTCTGSTGCYRKRPMSPAEGAP